MPSAVKMRTDLTPAELRRLAASSKHANQSRRLLSLAAVMEGRSREEAARIGGMDRQTLRDWVHRFSASFNAILQVDGYTAYTSLAKARVKFGTNQAIKLAVRWAHLRRKFYDLHISGVSQAATDTILAMSALC